MCKKTNIVGAINILHFKMQNINNLPHVCLYEYKKGIAVCKKTNIVGVTSVYIDAYPYK